MYSLGWLLAFVTVFSSVLANGEDSKIFKANQRAFSARMYHKLQVMHDETENIIFSPASIFHALGMVLAGAKGNTAYEIQRAMRTNNTNEELDRLFKTVYGEKFNSSSNSQKTTMASRAFIKDKTSLYSNYTDILKHSYFAEAEKMDFGNVDASVKRINSWVEQKTESLIKDLVSKDMFSDLTRCVLVNALYFKASWKYIFYNIDPMIFHAPKKNVTVPYMERITYFKHKIWNNRLLYLVIPYQRRKSEMIIIMPTTKRDWKLLNSHKLAKTFRNLKKWKTKWHEEHIRLRMPQFSVEQTMDVKKVLKGMSVEDMFNKNKADLSGMTNDPIYISDFVHKAKITVHENGTVAAAASGPIITLTSLPQLVKIDRPFLFAIYQRGTILFMGKVVDPS